MQRRKGRFLMEACRISSGIPGETCLLTTTKYNYILWGKRKVSHIPLQTTDRRIIFNGVLFPPSQCHPCRTNNTMSSIPPMILMTHLVIITVETRGSQSLLVLIMTVAERKDEQRRRFRWKEDQFRPYQSRLQSIQRLCRRTQHRFI